MGWTMRIFAFAVLLTLIFESHCGQYVLPASNVTVSSKTATSISLRWDPASNASHYQVVYQEKDSSSKIRCNETNSTTFIIDGLQPYTEYSIEVSVTIITPGDEANNYTAHYLTVKTDEALPSKPDGLTAHFTSPSNLSISWTILAADKVRGIVREYRYIVYDGNSIKVNETTANTTSHVMVNKLDACREYVIKVSASTGAGTGDYSDFKLGNSCPRITFFRPRVVAKMYSSVIMPCNFTGTPKPSVSWILNDNDLLEVGYHRHMLVTTSGIIYKHRSLYSNGSLVIDIVDSQDLGLYQCRVQSIAGSDTANISLGITAGSTVVRFSFNIHNLTNITNLISPNSQSFMHPAPSIAKEVRSMYNAGKVFYNVENVRATISSPSNDNRTLQVDVSASFNSSQNQLSVEVDIVSVMITNTQDGRLGSLYVSDLTVQGAPPPPEDLTVTRLRPTYVVLRWKTPLHATLYELDVYSIQYKEHGKKMYKTVDTVENDGPVIYGLLDGLAAGKPYVVRVQSRRTTVDEKESRGAKKEIVTPDPLLNTILLTIVLPVVLAMLAVFLFCVVLRSNFQKANQEQALRNIRRPTAGNREDNPYNIGRLLQEFPTKWKELNRSDLVVGKELGAGAFGTVYRADLKIDDKKIPCAVKMLKPYATEREHRDLFNELNLMTQVGYHPNVISLVGACTTDGPLWLVVKLAENGSLLEFLYKHRVPDYLTDGTDHSYMNVPGTSHAIEPLEKLQKLQFAHGIAKGMSHLEKLKCVHRDLAARNVLLGKRLLPMVSDFGMGRDIYESGMYEDCKGGKRPVRWMAPEAIEDYTCTCKSDVWSFGVTLWEIETAGTVPYAGIEGSMDILNAVKKGYRLEQPTACEDDVYEIMQACWRANPLNRPSFKDLTSMVEEMLTGISEYLELQPIEDEYQEVFLSAYDEVIIDPSDMNTAEDVPNGNISTDLSQPPREVLSYNNEPTRSIEDTAM